MTGLRILILLLLVFAIAFGANGTRVGPDLTTLNSRLEKGDVLEAILWPSRTITTQFDSPIIETTDGRIIN